MKTRRKFLLLAGAAGTSAVLSGAAWRASARANTRADQDAGDEATRSAAFDVNAPEAAWASSGAVLIELFTSQGCGACPAANMHAATLVDRPDLVVLSYPVDYWDVRGWQDTLAKPEFTQRQQDYAMKVDAIRRPYTPQMVFDGAAHAPGNKPDRVARAIESRHEARVGKGRPAIGLAAPSDGMVAVAVNGPAPQDGDYALVAVHYAPGPHPVAVTAGENAGKTVAHVNVVQAVHRRQAWSGAPVAFMEPLAAGEALAVVVQNTRTGHVLAAARYEPASAVTTDL